MEDAKDVREVDQEEPDRGAEVHQLHVRQPAVREQGQPAGLVVSAVLTSQGCLGWGIFGLVVCHDGKKRKNN